MIGAEQFVQATQRKGFGLYTGVPCSYLKPFINYVIDAPELRYVGAANEGDAVAIAAGSELAGVRSVAMFQNSGLGNAVNPLSSLTDTFRIPMLLITTLRGEPGGAPDEPQHELMGRITTRMLETLEIPWQYFPSEASQVAPMLEQAVDYMVMHNRPFALVMRQGSVSSWPIRSRPEPRSIPAPPAPMPAVEPVATRAAMLRALQSALKPTDAVIATTGYTGRELFATSDLAQQFYMVGSMGCASSFALGIALAQPQRRVIVLDGDGAILMRLGALTTIGYERPANLVHLVLDNQTHESTGGQATVSHSVDLCAVAAACGYPRTARAETPEALVEFLQHNGELSFLHVRIRPGAPDGLPRPTLTPPAVAQRFRAWLESTS